MGVFFQICRLTFARESCWNDFLRPPAPRDLGTLHTQRVKSERQHYYLDDGPVGVGDTLLREALQRLVPEQTERIMGKWTQTYFDQGKAEGLTQGWAEGRTEGVAKVLVRLIEKRFGGVSPRQRQRIFSADVATLEGWVERVSDAPDLQSVFESN